MSDVKPKLPTKARRALLRFRGHVASHCLSLCWGTYMLGLIWLLLHPAITVTTGEPKCRGTYMSENALLIDLMEARASHQEAHTARGFHQELLELPGLPPSGCGDNCSHVVDWIDAQLRGLDRVEAYSQVFQTDEASTPRTNVYGILRASPLADGKEAIVLVTHYRNIGADIGVNSGLSLGLALLKYLARAKWLAKDVVLLAADDGAVDGSDGYAPGTEAWLQAYHLDSIESGLQGVLPMRAGVIRAAVNLETMVDSHQVGSVGIYTAGMNGQLPNLDLVNTAVRAFRQHRIPTILHRADAQEGGKHDGYVTSVLEFFSNLSEKYTPPEFKESARIYLTSLKGMLHFMTTLAAGPSGPHANFISYNIDSITLSLTKSPDSDGRPLAAREILRSIEMVVRALSNLEEKLHQSFFLYVLPSTSTFVSVGEYIYTVILAISPAIAHLLYLANQTTGMRVAFALTVFIIVETLCVLLLLGVCNYFATPTALLKTFSPSDVTASRWFVLVTALSIMQALVVVVVMPALRSVTCFSGCVEIYDWTKKVTTYEADQQKKISQEYEGKEQVVADTKRDPSADIPTLDAGWRAIKFITMAVLVFAHCIMAILNYPMALFCAIPMTHFARVVPSGNATISRNVWNGLWLVVSSPLVLLILLNWSRLDVIAGLSYAVDSFVHRINFLALAYLCCIYVSVHTLSLVIWAYPSPARLDQKQKLE
ncbi:Glycosylphosphatidylinositol anchor attachment 1 protein [Phytophthora pseudosyringae]|uniref:Glycosylphosphatidylinositol anchor attachment 1 protein n=1 Tax=Phytophthora pseudosyringae TaxID=221518 RepID=A0A8T1VVC7_9STRA|nr:Glycosylphosphatidylinositol anchor attachment 1 protein [Phytophthora pseudosyringae]